MEKMFLKQLSQKDGKDVFLMLKRIKPGKDRFNNPVYNFSYKEFKKWLIQQNNWSMGKNLPKGYVVQTTYWLYKNNTPVGYGKLRDKLTKESKKFGGNIGIAIDPLHRGKGYGTILLSKLIKKAKERNISEILSTVEIGNVASKKIHLKCGGILIKTNKERYFFKFN